jgi:hypothetical protein
MGTEHDEVDTGNGPDEDTIKAAREMGWTPQDKFKGDPEKWVDADEFVRRGEHLMPILRKTNTRLKGELAERDSRIDNLTTELDNMRGTLERLDAHYSEANKRAANAAITTLKDQLKQAREDEDIDKETELLEQIGLAQSEVRRLTEEEDQRKKEKEKGDKGKDDDKGKKGKDGLDPELREWQEENKWFGTETKKTRQFNRIAADLREELNEAGEEDKYSPVEFLEECQRQWEETYGDGGGQRQSKTDSSSRSSRGNEGGGQIKGWNNLPKEAKEACLADVPTLVGPDKRFKTEEEWKKEYVRIYNLA